MAFELKLNTGSLFRNDRKQHDNHPDFTGQINVEGQLFWLNMWDNSGSGKGPLFKLTIKPKDQGAAPERSAPSQKRAPF